MICRQILGCGHPSRNSMAGITSWSMVTGCLLPKSDLIFICCWCLSRLLTDFVCLYNYEFWLSLCKIVRSSVILLLPLFIGWDFYQTWPWTTQQVCDFRLTLLKPMIKYQIAAINNYWEKCYEHLGTNGRTEVKQYTPPPFPVERGYNKAPTTYDHSWFCY